MNLQLYTMSMMCFFITVGASAFANWIYKLDIRVLRPPGSYYTVNVSTLSVLLKNLQPETLYEIVLSACAPDLLTCQQTQNKLVFSTKSSGN